MLWLVCIISLCILVPYVYTYSREGFQQSTPKPTTTSPTSNKILCDLLTTTRGKVQDALNIYIKTTNEAKINALKDTINEFNVELAASGCAV
jgi:hypothetical protein